MAVAGRNQAHEVERNDEIQTHDRRADKTLCDCDHADQQKIVRRGREAPLRKKRNQPTCHEKQQAAVDQSMHGGMDRTDKQPYQTSYSTPYRNAKESKGLIGSFGERSWSRKAMT